MWLLYLFLCFCGAYLKAQHKSVCWPHSFISIADNGEEIVLVSSLEGFHFGTSLSTVPLRTQLDLNGSQYRHSPRNRAPYRNKRILWMFDGTPSSNLSSVSMCVRPGLYSGGKENKILLSLKNTSTQHCMVGLWRQLMNVHFLNTPMV